MREREAQLYSVYLWTYLDDGAGVALPGVIHVGAVGPGVAVDVEDEGAFGGLEDAARAHAASHQHQRPERAQPRAAHAARNHAIKSDDSW